MAKIAKSTEVTYILTLTEAEAIALKDIVGATNTLINEEAGIGSLVDRLYEELPDFICTYTYKIIRCPPPF